MVMIPTGVRCSLITPNVLRLDSEETIIVDGNNAAFDADVIVQDFPQRTLTLVQGKVLVNKENGFLGTIKLTIPGKVLKIDPKKKQYVYVTVKSTSCNLEKVILVSFQSGHIFMQTDKPIYTPGSTVLYRIFSVTPRLQPVEASVIIEILNPENVIISSRLQLTKTGVLSLSYVLTEPVSFGIWTISAKFQDADTQNYITNFEVKEYVLPSFEVKIESTQRFLYLNDQELRVRIYANYLPGKPVNGHAFALFGVKRDNEKKSLTDTLRRVSISNGEGTAILERNDLVKFFQKAEDMLQWRLYVTVTVITDSGSDMVEAELDNIYIVTSPYKILFTKSPKFFKPRMPYDFTVLVTYPDGSPAQGVPVVAEPGAVRATTQDDGTVRLTVNVASDKSSLEIRVTTTDPKLTKDQQASATMVASAYKSSKGNYLYIGHSIRGVLKPGENIPISFIIRNTNSAVGNQITNINYMILNKGRIIRVGRQEKPAGQTLVTMVLPVTEEFIPSFRVLAYYVVTTGAVSEIVADSVWVDVTDTCMGTLQVTGDKIADNAIQNPRASMKLRLTADYKASVGLVAVDKGVYVHNSKYKISQRKVWDSVNKYDIGCTPGSGADAPGVFYDAGLALQTNFQVTTPQRSEPLCQTISKRRRRSADDGSEYIEDVEIKTRTEFPESWLWVMETMNERPDANGISTKTISLLLKESITTWEVLAVSLSENKGICVSQPHEIQVMKTFSIELKMPYSVARNEQVEIRAILYNYGSSSIKARIDWTYNDQFCSLSTAKNKYRQEKIVEPQSSVTVPFIIVPLTAGYQNVEVKATSQLLSDGVKKRLKVVPAGRRLTQVLKSVILDPEVKGKDGVQEELIPAMDDKKIVPRSEVVTIVTVQGNPVYESVMEPINGINLNHLISAPSGNGEQNMMRMTTPVIVTYYLDTTGQWDRVGVQRREKAIQYIQDGFTKQMAYRKPDSSYSALTTKPSSTWLTAYVVKVFTLAERLLKVDSNVICNSVKWLIQQKQKDGVFQENAPITQQEMAGGITKDAELDSTLTAFVLIAMLESEQICGPQVDSLQESIGKATTFLNGKYLSLKKPYSIAITSYALARAGKLQDTNTLMSVSTDNSNWVVPGSQHLSLEATSYALLTLLNTKQFEQAGPVARWLTEQKFYGVIYGATQATIMVLQALAQYQIDAPLVKDLDMDITYQLPGQSKPIIRHLTLQNSMVAFSDQTSVRREFKVTAKGKGQATLKLLSVYYAIETEKEKTCNNFDLSVKIKDEPLAKGPEGTKSTVSITICTRSLKSQDATMSILDISMMTGFAPDINDLNTLKNREDKYISNYEIDKGKFDKNTLILYLDKISYKAEDCITFNLHQYFDVGLIQPASVTVYDYYSPENRCTKFYHVEERSKLLSTICQGEVCRCAAGSLA
ncbi:A.superbus venom factor 1-like [Pseudophryne corroboree]|uniref:A.superbus venom factor 1-like n=1 Tax=Pseudophryne corroboree TaxID=495146 RepID=UPI003081D907